MITTLVLAQNLGEYGALAGGASALERFLNAADHAVRIPETAVPLAILVVIGGYFLLRRR